MFKVVTEAVVMMGLIVIVPSLKQFKTKWPQDCSKWIEIQTRLLSLKEIISMTTLSTRSFVTEDIRQTLPIDVLAVTVQTHGHQITQPLKCSFKESLKILVDNVTLSWDFITSSVRTVGFVVIHLLEKSTWTLLSREPPMIS